MSDTIMELTARILAFRDARDWAQFHSPKNLSMALAIEAAEIMDIFRWSTEIESRQIATNRPGAAANPAALTQVTEEIADVAVFLLILCHETGVDLREAVLAKLRDNELRYPVEQARGRAEKWTAYKGYP